MNDEIEATVKSINTLVKNLLEGNIPLYGANDSRKRDLMSGIGMLLEATIPQWAYQYRNREPSDKDELNQAIKELITSFVIVVYGQDHKKLVEASKYIDLIKVI